MNVLMAPRWSAPLACTAFISGDAARLQGGHVVVPKSATASTFIF
jgi:hypothetical protein